MDLLKRWCGWHMTVGVRWVLGRQIHWRFLTGHASGIKFPMQKMVGSRVESNMFMLFTFPLKILGYMVTCFKLRCPFCLFWNEVVKLFNIRNWELYIMELYVFSFGMYLQCKSTSVSQWRLTLRTLILVHFALSLWHLALVPQWTRIRGEKAKVNKN